MRRHTRAAVLFAAATGLFGLSLFALLFDPLPAGLRATYFSTPDWSGPPTASRIDRRLSTDAVLLAWRDNAPPAFSVAWTGSLFVEQPGDYTIAVASDDGAEVRVDDRTVVDNGGIHPRRSVVGRVTLDRGPHRLLVTYFQNGGSFSFDVQWSRDGGPFSAIDPIFLAPRNVTASRFSASLVVRKAAAAMAWLWVAALAAFACAALLRPIRRAWLASDVDAVVEWTLLGIGAGLLVLVLPHQISSDGFVRYRALERLVDSGDRSAWLFYSLIAPVCSAPLYLLGLLAGSPRWWCERFNALVLLGGLAAMWQVVRRGEATVLFRRMALLVVGASMISNHLQNYFGDVFTAVLVAAGLVALEYGWTGAGTAAAAVGVANTPATLVPLAAAALVRCWQTRRLRALAPVAGAAALIAAESLARRGTALPLGYAATYGNASVLTYAGRPGFSYPMFFGLLSVTLSFGKGLAFFAPGLLLPVRRRASEVGAHLANTYVAWVAFVVGLVVIYAKWWAWFGGWTWGPRFFLFAVFPASMALAIAIGRFDTFSTAGRFGILAALTLSSWVAIDGALFGLAALDVCLDDNFASLCWYVPEFSPLWRPFVQFVRPGLPSTIVGLYFVSVYAWFARPLVRNFVPTFAAQAAASWRSLTTGEPWRL